MQPTIITPPTHTPQPGGAPEPAATPVPVAAIVFYVTGPPSAVQGAEFEVSVLVHSGLSLSGGSFRLTFDPAYLQAVPGSLAAGEALAPRDPVVAGIDNAAGQAWFAANRQAGWPELSGELVLARLRFQAIAPAALTVIGIQDAVIHNAATGPNPVPAGQAQPHAMAVVLPPFEPAQVSGQATLEGRAPGRHAGTWVALEGTGLSAITDSAGSFVVSGVAPGLYTVTADAAGYLPARCAGLPAGAPQTVLAPVVLAAGDLNDDNRVDVADAVAIGAVLGDAGGRPGADVNGDGSVDVLDLILVSGNLGRATTAWACW